MSDVIWQLEADGEGTLAMIEEIDAALQQMADSIATVSEASGELTSLDDILSAIQAQTDATETGFGTLNGTLIDISNQVYDLTAAIGSLNDTLAANAAADDAAAAGAQTAGDGIKGMGTSAEEAAGMMDGLQAAMGPLMMIATGAAMAGGAFVSMGLDGQKGEALLSGAAGASQQDIQALQEEALKLGENLTQAEAGFYQVESAGYSGSQGILVFDNAMRLAEGDQARASDVMSAMTSIMHAYGVSASQSGQVSDVMAEAVLRGAQSMQDFSSSIGPLAAAGHNVGFSFQEVAAAEATFTMINKHVMQDAQQLRFLFNATSLSIDGVANTAKKLHLSFDETRYKSMDLIERLRYLAQISGGTNTEAFKKLVGGSAGLSAALALLSGGGKAFEDNMKAMAHSTGATETAFQSWESTVPSHLDKIGAAVSVFATRFMDAIGPKVIPIIDKVSSAIGQFANYFSSHVDQMMPIVYGLAAALGVALVGALVALVATIWPVLLAMLAVGAVVAGVVYAFQHWGEIMGRVNAALKIPAIHEIMTILQQIGSYIASLFVPIWHQLVQMWQSQLLPLFHQLQGAVQPLIPVLEFLGAIVGGVVVLALGFLVGAISGTIKAIAGFLSGLIVIIGGIVRLFTGLMQIFGGVVGIFVDLFTGNFGHLRADLGMIWQGVINLFLGGWDIIRGSFLAAWLAISGYVSGFVAGIIGFFTHLWDALVGHSIIPDMVNGIFQWFEHLVSQGLTFITNLVMGILMWMVHMEMMVLATIDEMVHIFLSWLDNLTGGAITKAQNVVKGIAGEIGKLGGMALQWGEDLIKGLISGIQNMLGSLGTAAQGVAGTIAKWLHFTKPDVGPLADADMYMPHFGDLLSKGLNDQVGKVKQAASGIAGALSTSVAPNVQGAASNVAPPTAIGGPIPGSASNSVLLQILAVLQQQGRGGSPTQQPNITMNNTNTFSGISNIQQLYAALNAMAGQAYESGLRGAY